MGAGISLMIVGAILAFAVRRETPGVDVQTVGVILLVAGALVIAHARRGSLRERTVTRVEDPLAGEEVATHHVVAVPEPDAYPVADGFEGTGQPEPAPGRRTIREHITHREVP